MIHHRKWRMNSNVSPGLLEPPNRGIFFRIPDCLRLPIERRYHCGFHADVQSSDGRNRRYWGVLIAFGLFSNFMSVYLWHNPANFTVTDALASSLSPHRVPYWRIGADGGEKVRSETT